MIETGLIIAQVVFLVLLYLFVWSVVRSSSRQIGAGTPPAAAPAPPSRRAAAPDAPPRRRRERRSRATVAAPVPAAPARARSSSRDTAESREDERAQAVPAAGPDVRERERARAEAAPPGLSANIQPRFVVERSPSLSPGQEVSLDAGLTIGRSSSSGIAIADPFVSHMHARIVRRGPFLFVEDLGSTNGTFLNDRRVDNDAQLKMRDQLRIGETILRYEE